MSEKCCPKCLQVKLLTDFYKQRSRKDGRQTYCKICACKERVIYYKKNRQREIAVRKKYQQSVRAQYLEYLSKQTCVDCGINDFVVLEFDHVRGTKEKNIADMVYIKSWSTILKEIQKCEIRCANCHRRRHYNERNDMPP